MNTAVSASDLVKRYDNVVAVDNVELDITGPSIVGLLGKNGSGKTTLIRLLMGLHLPSSGTVSALGVSSDQLDHETLANIGYVPQEIRLLDWMTVQQHLKYVASFYPRWDTERQETLLTKLELNTGAIVGKLSQGNLQKLAIILAVCHHPKLLVLDEPVSDLDPIVRRRFLAFLFELMREDGATVLISSHVLRDVEKVVDHVICIDQGKLVTDASLDDLKESYAEWWVDAGSRTLPAEFAEPYVLAQQVDGGQARLYVDASEADREAFNQRHGVVVKASALNLEDLFPLLLGEASS